MDDSFDRRQAEGFHPPYTENSQTKKTISKLENYFELKKIMWQRLQVLGRLHLRKASSLMISDYFPNST